MTIFDRDQPSVEAGTEPVRRTSRGREPNVGAVSLGGSARSGRVPRPRRGAVSSGGQSGLRCGSARRVPCGLQRGGNPWRWVGVGAGSGVPVQERVSGGGDGVVVVDEGPVAAAWSTTRTSACGKAWRWRSACSTPRDRGRGGPRARARAGPAVAARGAAARRWRRRRPTGGRAPARRDASPRRVVVHPIDERARQRPRLTAPQQQPPARARRGGHEQLAEAGRAPDASERVPAVAGQCAGVEQDRPRQSARGARPPSAAPTGRRNRAATRCARSMPSWSSARPMNAAWLLDRVTRSPRASRRGRSPGRPRRRRACLARRRRPAAARSPRSSRGCHAPDDSL